MTPAPRRAALLSLPVAAWLLSGMLAGLGGYTVHYAEGLSYLSDDPAACVNCHVMRDHYDSWHKSSHHAVAVCNDCHTPHDVVGKYAVKAENGLWHSTAFTLQDFHEPIMIRESNARVLQGTCVDCHRDVADAVLPTGDIEDGGAAACVRCHSGVGHGPRK